MIYVLMLALKYLRRAVSQMLKAEIREAGRALLNFFLVLPHVVLLLRPACKRCPLCGWRGAHFLPKLGTDWKITSEHTCPKCSSDKRYRTYAAALQRWLPASGKPMRIL